VTASGVGLGAGEGAPGGRPREHRRAETIEPAERDRVRGARLVASYAAAVLLPLAVAACLVPFREDHARVTAIVLVLPVLVVAAIGTTGPAVVGALAAGLAYDFLLARPHYRLAIDDPDDVVAMVTLVVAGLLAGLQSLRLVRARARNVARRRELVHLIRLVDAAGEPEGRGSLEEEACRRRTDLLDLEGCRWVAGAGHGAAEGGLAGATPVLLPTGWILGYVSELNEDRATLPPEVELPACVDGHEVGRFVLTSKPGHVSSVEERAVAAAIGSVYALAGAVRQAR